MHPFASIRSALVLPAFTLAAAAFAPAVAHAAWETHTVKLPKSVKQAADLNINSIPVEASGGGAIVDVRAVAVMGRYGKYLRCGSQYNDAPLDGTSIENKMVFLMMELANGQVVFRNYQGHYLTAENGGGSYVNCEETRAHSSARWIPIEQPNGQYAFEATSGHYLVNHENGYPYAHNDHIGIGAKFTIIDLGEVGTDAMPDISLQYANLDNEADREMILLVKQENGGGFMMIDPLGIVDTLDKLGYATGQGYSIWDALSTTQKAALLNQVNAVGSYGSVVRYDELAVVLSRMDPDEERVYQTYEFREQLDATGFNGSTCYDNLCTKLDLGPINVMVEFDEFGPGFELAATVATTTVSYGVVSATADVGTVSAVAHVDADGFTLGAPTKLVSVATGVGKENGTYVGVSTEIRNDFWLDAKYGNDVYGFTLGLPYIPLGVALYVKGSDAVWLFEEINYWSYTIASAPIVGAQIAYHECMAWADGADEDVQFAISETENFTKATIAVSGNAVIGGLSDGEDAMVHVYQNASDAVESTMSDFSDGVEDAFNGVDNAVNDLGDAIGNVVEDAGDIFCGNWNPFC